ncbi:hypothetical protein Tco_0749368 [Tanacetum coccineum]|uniref:Uncharacterized protein n=1 Tax=Tanacetum coccineum TaxID=301880 RepID=A0ABQ4Z193_9ASTR
MEKPPTESNLSITGNDINIELNKEFLVVLRKNIFHRTYKEDVVDHIAKILKMVDSIYISGTDSHQLRMKIFPLSLADDDKEWWISEGDGKIPFLGELVETLFYRFYPESYDREDEMLDEGDNWGIDPIEFLSNVNTSFKNHKKVDGRTKKVLFHAWMNRNWNKRRIDDNILRSNNTTADSFFKPYLITHDMPEDIIVPLILGRPILSTARAKIDVYKRKITLRVGEENIIFKSVKHASSLIKRVYMLSLRERTELDLEARLMGESLVINRSLDPLNRDYIELNDLNEPFELRGNQGDDLMPTIEEGEVIEEFRTRDKDLDTGIEDYPRALMNVPIFVGTFSVVTDFAVLEDMNAYRDEGMGDVIVCEPFFREVGIKARRFDGMVMMK